MTPLPTSPSPSSLIPFLSFSVVSASCNHAHLALQAKAEEDRHLGRAQRHGQTVLKPQASN